MHENLTAEEREYLDRALRRVEPGMKLKDFALAIHAVGRPSGWKINRWGQLVRDAAGFNWNDRSLAANLTTWRPRQHPEPVGQSAEMLAEALDALAGVTEQLDFCERLMDLGIPEGWTRLNWACLIRDRMGYSWSQASLATQLAPGRREQNKGNCRKWIEVPGNREANNKRVLDYMLDRFANDPLFALGSRLRVDFLRLTKADAVSKEDGGLFHFDLPDGSRHSITRRKLLGCSVEDFHVHIERQFTEGMTWENWGEWEYDHRIPIKVFYDDPTIEVLRVVCYWSNWQPMWKPDNRAKGGKYCKRELATLLREAEASPAP